MMGISSNSALRAVFDASVRFLPLNEVNSMAERFVLYLATNELILLEWTRMRCCHGTGVLCLARSRMLHLPTYHHQDTDSIRK